MEANAVEAVQLYKYNVEMPEQVNLAVVITGEIAEEGQRHTGFVVRNFLGQCQLYHLGANNLYFQSELTERYNYLLIPILEPETETALMSFLCLLLENTEGKVPYSIVWDERPYFTEQSELLDLELSDGFTCATFVLETFKRYGLDLVDRSTWPINPGDVAWQESVIEKVNLSKDQFLAQVARVGKYPRFRPEQALGAAHYYRGARLSYAKVLPAGHEVLTEMTRLRA